jgi:hypothetical protein
VKSVCVIRLHAEDKWLCISGEGTITTDVLYQLAFDPQNAETRFSLAVPADGAYVIFTEHVPTEFEATSHYLQNAAEEDIEPVAPRCGSRLLPAPPENPAGPLVTFLVSACMACPR